LSSLAIAGLLSCSFLVIFIDLRIWLVGSGLVAVGPAWQ
jgi:hypothetical protein